MIKSFKCKRTKLSCKNDLEDERPEYGFRRPLALTKALIIIKLG